MPFIRSCAGLRWKSSSTRFGAGQAAVEPEEEDESRLDILDDPVQMYLRQMGKVPLLTREQEVQICKRIEEGETEARRILFGFGFTSKGTYRAGREAVVRSPPRAFRPRDCLIKRWRAGHPFDGVAPLIKRARELDHALDKAYDQIRVTNGRGPTPRALAKYLKLDKSLQGAFPKFYYKPKVSEEIMIVSDNVADQVRSTTRAIEELQRPPQVGLDQCTGFG